MRRAISSAGSRSATAALIGSEVITGVCHSVFFWVLVRLPVPVFGLLLGREWFAEPGAATTTISSDILATAAPKSEPSTQGRGAGGGTVAMPSVD